MPENCTPEVQGRHEEKLNNLEKRLEGLHVELKQETTEIKSDLKELISALQKYIEKEHEATHLQLEKLQDILVDQSKTITEHDVKIKELETFKDKVYKMFCVVLQGGVGSLILGIAYYILKHVFGF